MLTRDEARIKWLRLMIPQLQAGGFTRLAAEYSVELQRLDARLNAATATQAPSPDEATQ